MDLADRLTAQALPLSCALLNYNDLSCIVRLVREASLSHSLLFFLLEYGLPFLLSLLIFIQTLVREDFNKVAFIYWFENKDFFLVEDFRVE